MAKKGQSGALSEATQRKNTSYSDLEALKAELASDAASAAPEEDAPSQASREPAASPGTTSSSQADQREDNSSATVKLKRLNADVPADLHRRFKLAVTAQGRTMNEVLEEFLREYAREHGM